MKTFWATFYSYKGGVGRSLALANIAALLVQKGRRVVLIDFDLEAPGLDSFDEFKCSASQQGVVEYVTEFEQKRIAPDISKFVHACELPGNLRGKLWIMPAGKKDAAYNFARTNLNWVKLYNDGIGEPFVENWKAAIAREYKPDYVLIDSRTGLTDVGGICTLHLPDLVVMLFGLNEQNVHGIAAVAKTISESDYKKVPQLHYVASPVPNLPPDKDGALAKRFDAATACLGAKIKSTIRYQASAALNEKLFVLDEQQSALPIVMDYSNLLGELILYNRNGIDFLITQVYGTIDSVDSEKAARLLDILEEEFPGRAESMMCRARLKMLLGRADEATELATDALKADPTYEEPFDWLIQQYRKKQAHDKSLEICNFVLQGSSHLPVSVVNNIHIRRGEIAMAAGHYSDAVESYAFAYNFEAKGENVRETVFIYLFNLLEANRRKTGVIEPKRWSAILELYESAAGELSAIPLSLQANRLQAIYIAFAAAGNIARARESLIKARHAAELLGAAEDIFTVKTYTFVPVKDFIQINDEMLAALDRKTV